MPTVTDPLLDEVVTAIRRHRAVSDVTLVGSQRDDTAGPLSDWDFRIDSTDAQQVFDDLPSIVASFRPLAAFWDPLGDRRNYMAIFPSMLKLDLHLDLPPVPHAPWQVNRDTLKDIDVHFWDWTLWLAGKTLRGQTGLVNDELVKMHRFLLGPLGCDVPPRTIAVAVTSYLLARDSAERAHEVLVSGGKLEQQVLQALRRHKIPLSQS